MLQLLETGRALYVLAALCILGVATRAYTRHLYKGLLKESGNWTLTKNKSLKELRQRAENTYRINQGMRDAGAWLEHQLYDLRIRGMSLQGWSNLSVQWTWLCLLAGGAGAFFSYWYRLDTSYIVMYGGGGVLLAMLTMLFDNGTNSGLKEQLVTALEDYMENVMAPRMTRGSFADSAHAETTASERGAIRSIKRSGGREKNSGKEPEAVPVKDKKAASVRDVDYLKHSLEQIAASREKGRAAQENWLKDLGPDEVELIGDILKQYLA